MLQQPEKRGFQYAPEVARQIIQEQVHSAGIALPWGDRKLYIQLMLDRSISSYKEHTPAMTPMFSDRGIPDTLTYARLIGFSDDEFIRKACRQYRYAPLVFCAPAWKEIYATDSERKQDFVEAQRTSQLNTEVYRECGYELVESKISSGRAGGLHCKSIGYDAEKVRSPRCLAKVRRDRVAHSRRLAFIVQGQTKLCTASTRALSK